MDEHMYIMENYLMIPMPEEVDHYVAEKIRKQADLFLQNEKVEHVVFDFAKTVFMDSSGIGVIAGRYQKIACFGGRVMAVHVSGRIRRILYMSGLQKFVEIMEDVEG